MTIIDNKINEHPDNLELPTNAPDMEEICMENAFLTSRGCCRCGEGPLTPTQIAAFKRWLVDARKEDKGR